MPDYAHGPPPALQLIFCLRGAATLVYEDQGAPFELRAGDCVLQPPTLRHRVLACSGGLEVLELSVRPSTPRRADRGSAPRTAAARARRTAASASCARSRCTEAAARTSKPTLDHACARDTWRARRDARTSPMSARASRGEGCRRAASLSSHDADFAFRFVLRGKVTLHVTDERRHVVAARARQHGRSSAQGDSARFPPGARSAWPRRRRMLWFQVTRARFGRSPSRGFRGARRKLRLRVSATQAPSV